MAETVGERIKRLAEQPHRNIPERGKHLAARLGVSFETLRQWTVGTSAPNRNRADGVAKVLGCTVEHLMHGTGPDGPPMPQLSAQAIEIAQKYDAMPRGKQATMRRLAEALMSDDPDPGSDDDDSPGAPSPKPLPTQSRLPAP